MAAAKPLPPTMHIHVTEDDIALGRHWPLPDPTTLAAQRAFRRRALFVRDGLILIRGHRGIKASYTLPDKAAQHVARFALNKTVKPLNFHAILNEDED